MILHELDDVATPHRRLGCSVLDTTGMALEQAAARVGHRDASRQLQVGCQPQGVVDEKSQIGLAITTRDLIVVGRGGGAGWEHWGGLRL